MVIAIPIYGWVTTFVLPPREVIVRVNDVEYDMGYLVKLMRMVQRQTEAGGQTVNLGTVPFQLVQDLATNELVVQGAQSQGLQVTPEELERRAAPAHPWPGGPSVHVDAGRAGVGVPGDLPAIPEPGTAY